MLTKTTDSNPKSASAPAEVRMYFGDNAVRRFSQHQLEGGKWIGQLYLNDSQ
jgi:hypothetical protein